jgi:hypothetical protein
VSAVKWEQCNEYNVPSNVRFDVPLQNQGQMIEHAYGTFGRYEADESAPWQRVTDKSTGRVAYYRRVVTP